METNMKLIYHPASPFSRKVYILAHELNLTSRITLEKVVVAPIPYPGWSDNNDLVASAGNPLAKIPTLVISDPKLGAPFALFDSKVICEYLLSISSCGLRDGGGDVRVHWQAKSVHAACDGMMDAEVLVVYEERIRAERGLKFQVWIEGQREKVRRGFDLLERMVREGVVSSVGAGKAVTLAEIAVAVVCGFFDVRGVEWRQGREELMVWFEGWKGRESFVKTEGRGW